MIFENVRYDRENGELCFKCSPLEGVKFTYGFRPGNYDIVPHRDKRSLNANSYAWVLIDKIAEKMKLSPEEVYRNAVKNTPGVTQSIICIKEEAAPAFIDSWERGHLGRQVKQFPAEEGYVNLLVIFGSSDYSRKQMAHFIDGLVQDARALDIETREPEYIDSLLAGWERMKNVK